MGNTVSNDLENEADDVNNVNVNVNVNVVTKKEEKQESITLSQEQIDTFKRDGILIVPNVLSKIQVQNAVDGLDETLVELDINPQELYENPYPIATVQLVGGITDIYYPQWKFDVMTHPNVHSVFQQLMQHTYASGVEPGFEQPYGAFDPKHSYTYIDRIGYRVPDKVFDACQEKADEAVRNARKSRFRTLRPHVDANPYHMFQPESIGDKWHTHGYKSRFRPVQCFVALSDNKGAECGGFRAAPGFHTEFEEYFQSRSESLTHYAPQREFYTLASQEHKSIQDRLRSDFQYDAGSMILWDWRIPHHNTKTHTGDETRKVVYCGLLPEVPINQRYVNEQIKSIAKHTLPPDFGGHRISTVVPKPDKPLELSLSQQKTIGIVPY
jgi:Gig2-like